MSEDTAKGYSFKDKAKSIAYSMKLVNDVYNRLVQMFSMQIREEIEDEYARGWNDAISMIIQFTAACKYTKEDLLDMLEEGNGNEHETTGS